MKQLKNPQRFWSKVAIGSPDECWNWTSCKIRGYGVMWHDGNNKRAPRISYFLAHGELPDDKVILHSCDNAACVNPAHLSLGSHTQNIAERHARGRTARAEQLPQTKIMPNARTAIAADPRTTAEVAASYGVHRSTILRIRREVAFAADYLLEAVQNIAGKNR